MSWRILFLIVSTPLFGAYVGNPADPALMSTGFFSTTYSFFKFTSGYVADYISDKQYVAKQTEPGFNPNDAFKRFGLYSQQASFSMIFIERLQLFGTAGGSKEHMKWKEKPTFDEVSEAVFDFQTTYHFSWSAGAKAVLFQWGQTYFSGDFTYFAVPSSTKAFFKYFNRVNIPIDLAKHEFHLREWQGSLGLSSRFWFFTPYVGGTYLYSKLHISGGQDVPAINYRNKDKFGYFYGFTISLTGRFHLNFERRVRDEYAYSFSTIAVF